jgi:diguanylate cyclase (GGDEF)-like protein/PAS domain S-box-containing protein
MLEAAFDAAMDPTLIAGADGHVFGFNAKFAELWGIPDEIMALQSDERALEFAIPQLKDPESFIKRIKELYETPEADGMDVIELLDGRIFERYSVPQRVGGEIVGRVWTFRDITLRRRIQDALQASEARFHSIFDHSAVGIALLDPQGRIVASNPALQQFLGYKVEELTDRKFYHLIPDEDANGLASALSAISGRDISELMIEQRFARHDGEIAWAALTMSRAHDMDIESVGVIAMIQDIRTRKSLEARLTHQASHDPLTNLANRTLFRQRLELALQRAANRDHVVVMFLDIDNFKGVNDTVGHAGGDQLLVVTAARLLNATRGSDTIARFGGDEFAILLENVRDDEETRIVAERINWAMHQPMHVGADTIVAGVSIGIARPQTDSEGADIVLRNADVAMYTAKAAGKGRYQFFEPSMHTAVVERVELEADLRRAVTSPASEFVLHYQPNVELDTNRVVGVEALVRWKHHRRGELQPIDFLAIAEETGLIVPLGRWVLREACAQAHGWWKDLPEDHPMTIAINVAGKQLQDPAFVSDVATALADSGLSPSRLVLEITETVIMDRTEFMMDRLTSLKKLGVHIAIDDFGTGYSALSYLRQFPIDIIKIDKSFIDGMEKDPASAALTRTIVGLGCTLGLSTIAEGVESASQRATLTELGCAIGQGYLFARPAEAADVSELISRPGTPRDLA